MRRMRISTGLAATLAACRRPGPRVDGNVGRTVGRTERERRRPLERHRSERDRRSAGRGSAAPASSSVLGGHRPRGDVRRRRRRRRRSRAVRDRCDRTSGRLGGRSGRDGGEGRPRRPRAASGRGRPDRLRHLHGVDPGRRCEGRRQGRRSSGRRGHARDADSATASTTSFPTSSRRRARACSSRSRRRRRSTSSSVTVRPFTYVSPSDYRPAIRRTS